MLQGISSYDPQNIGTGVMTAKNTLGKDEFLKLFVKQLQNQDPTKPMDSSQLTAQLAQFSSLEQLNNISVQMKDLLTYQNSLQNTMTTGFIGKQVKLAGDSVKLINGNAGINYSLSGDAAKVRVSIYDSAGNLVREGEAGPQKAGFNLYAWDGKDAAGNTLPDGQYKFKVESLDASGKAVDTTTMTYGTVTGITFENNTTYLVLDETKKIQLSDVKEIKGGV